ncbi:B12-binding domain-containing protein [Desulfosporosinus sp. BICA1-9]|uniref:cobalamin B12-binding domain-containing protein n=1 Tax=Desulfosporosinus sp. BICA1-9 TaxID=1531958 RepID=UPI00054BD08A|nr:cobalamin-dependent protein [Desulfosporosinus sp. BICA1-9]KJS89377.1 MAG: methyltransferase [Desulfosporosinus sp. BICA1-9]
MSVLEQIKEFVIAGSAKKVKEYTEQAVAEGLDASTILNDGLITGMNVVGIRFKANEVYVPEVLMSARAMHTGLAVVKPLIVNAGIKEKGVVAIGTVQGDLHDIGKNLVIMMLEGAGYKVIDIGVDVSTEKFIQVIEEQQPQIVGVSALLTTTMTQMQHTVEKLQAYRDKIKIIIGGAPVTQAFADEIGADGYAADAASTVDLVQKLTSI